MNVLKCIGAAMCLFAAAPAVHADVIANWTFETSAPTTAGPIAPELGVHAGTSSASGFHTGTSTYSSPGGNGSLKSYSSNTWTTIGDYYQFQVDTTGYNSITFGWSQFRSGTGPATFDLQYRVGTTGAFTTLTAGYTVVSTPSWATTGTPSAASIYAPVAAPLASNAAIVQFRLVSTVVAASGGTNRVDDVIVSGALIGAATGACCAGDGTCTSIAQAGCTGTYQGDNVTCGSVTCPVTNGACCNSTGGGCTVVANLGACATPNVFLGSNTVCGTDNVNCANGACCQTSGACSTTLSGGCISPSTFIPATSCNPTNPCPQPGACCNASTGVCTLTTQTICLSGGNTYNGAATCSNVTPFTCPQPSGACCNNNSSATCVVTTSDLCAANGFFGANTTCAAVGSCTPPQVVISQIYGGGGNSGATFTNDFIELFNRGHTPVSLNGWSVQYAASAGITWQTVALSNTTLAPGQYYLIQLGAGTTVTNAPLPLTADATAASINMSGTNGKVALSRLASALNGGCASTAGVVADFVGFGAGADCREGAAAANNAPAPANNAAAMFRNSAGCADSNNNGADFTAISAPAPRNTTVTSECPLGNPPSGVGSASPNPACQGTLVTFTVTTTNGSDPVNSVTGDFSAIAGNNPEFFTNSAANTWTFQLTLGNIAQQLWNIPVTIFDSGGRSTTVILPFTVSSCNSTLSSATADANFVCNGTQTRLFVTATPGPNSSAANLVVTSDLSSIGITTPNPVTFTRVGVTNVYEYFATVAAATPIGAKTLVLNLTDNAVQADTKNLALTTAPCTNSNSKIVISQVFGGGGNSGAIFANDYVELFNRSGVPVDISGWSLQYGSDTDGGFSGSIGSGANANAPVPLSGTIAPGKYYLIQLAAGANTAAPTLPAADLIGVPAIPLSSTAGRIALVRNSVTALGTTAGGACSNSSIEDFIGYGPNAECFEGDTNLGPSAALSNTTAAFRRLAGCQDTNRNSFDFFTGIPAPRNSATAANNCVPVVAGGTCCRGSTCSTAYADAAACAAAMDTVSPATVVSKFVSSASTCNTPVTTPGSLGNTTSPCCYANYNHNATLEVQDIFDFLNDWFAGKKAALVGGNGATGTLAVQNIFDFLNSWFSGGCN